MANSTFAQRRAAREGRKAVQSAENKAVRPSEGKPAEGDAETKKPSPPPRKGK